MWLSLRDVPFGEVRAAVAGARWGVLLALSIPAYLVIIWFRALRWRHLTDPIQPIATGTLARAVSVGFMANNVFPLRIGEVVRAWYLGRETGASVAAIFGTVILERVVDVTTLIVMALIVMAVWGVGGDDTLARAPFVLMLIAALPIAFLVLLRAAPQPVIALAHAVLRPFSARIAELTGALLQRFSEGLGALRGGRHLLWIAIHSLVIWLLVSPITILAGFLALGIDLGTPLRSLQAAWTTQVAIGLAVALPSAPGFFGIFHYACRLALVGFGVAPQTAVAAGTLIHAVMWVTLTALGLVVLRGRRTSLSEVDRAVGGTSDPDPR